MWRWLFRLPLRIPKSRRTRTLASHSSIHRATPPPPPELADDLLGEIFLCLPPDDPACLLRASLACKRWRRVLADPAFRRRYRELYRTPSLVGFLSFEAGEMPYVSCFVPDNPAYGCPAARDLPGRRVLDSRHGRVLSVAPSPSLGTQLNYDLVVWDPLTKEQRWLPQLSPPPRVVLGRHFNAAVLCSATAEACDHSNCHGGPFRVVFVWSHPGGGPSLLTSARVYSSETGSWSEPITVEHPNVFVLDVMPCPSTLVGDTLYFRFGFVNALEYQVGARRLSIILGPPRSVFRSYAISLMSMEDGGLGCMNVEEDDESRLCLRLWSRDANSRCDEDAGWTRGRAIDLEKLLPNGALPSPAHPHFRIPSTKLLGFVEGTDVIFVGTLEHPSAVYMVQFNSRRARKVFDLCTIVVPYTSFCIPGWGLGTILDS